MIGFHCPVSAAPASPGQRDKGAPTSSPTSSSTSGALSRRSSSSSSCSSASSPLSSPRAPASSSSSNSNAHYAHQLSAHLHNHNQHHHQLPPHHHNHHGRPHLDLLATRARTPPPGKLDTLMTQEPDRKRASSPGYHSAASSPGSCVSSPVSSSSSSGISAGSSPGKCAPATLVSSIAAASIPLPEHHHAHHQFVPEPQARRAGQQPTGGQLHALLDYFGRRRATDGLQLSWWHEANSRASLAAALSSGRMFVAGDIALAEMSRYPVPIMARPPLGVSDLTLEQWLADVAGARKGVKLTFTSTRTVEPAFRVLARHADQLKGPLILSADILERPASGRGGGQQPGAHKQSQAVDAWTFLMLCRTRFPRSIISIGWCPAAPATADAHAAAPASPDSSALELDLQAHQMGGPFACAGRQLPSPFVAQLAAVAAASQQQQQQQQTLAGRQLMASVGSLNSSSGNSSGSPSPTSPVGVGQHQLSTGSAVKSAHWPAMAAALVAAQNAAALQQQDNAGPLNLNINEADPQHATSGGATSTTTLDELAHTIHSLQRRQAAPASEATAAALALASKLFPAAQQQQQQQKWEHVSKKAALAPLANSDSPSPVSTSPHLLCVRRAVGASGNRVGGAYTREMIDKMASLVKEYNLSQPVTFPVEARSLVHGQASLNELQRLLYQVGPNATLTLVAQPEDLISARDLLQIKRQFAPHQLLFDLPDELRHQLSHHHHHHDQVDDDDDDDDDDEGAS